MYLPNDEKHIVHTSKNILMTYTVISSTYLEIMFVTCGGLAVFDGMRAYNMQTVHEASWYRSAYSNNELVV